MSTLSLIKLHLSTISWPQAAKVFAPVPNNSTTKLESLNDPRNSVLVERLVVKGEV